ncbi:MAG: hypothetical protein GY910_26235 [bacterium]|nr:hypothetical protein [bacterium]
MSTRPSPCRVSFRSPARAIEGADQLRTASRWVRFEKLALTIPAGTDNGTRLRLRGKGVPAALGRKAGDLLVRVQVKLPKELDEAAAVALDPEQAEDLRLAKVLVEELGVNAAGIEVALHLRRRLLALEHRARRR